MMMGGCLAVVPLVEKACASPIGRASMVALTPFLLLAGAVTFGYVETAKVYEMATCISSCECARSWAIGAVFLWALGIQQCLKQNPALPKIEESSPEKPITGKISGKPAAKAA